MGKGSSSAPSPDPNIGRAALKQAETGEEWLAFAREQFAISTERQAELDELTKKISNLQIGLAEDQASWGREDRERWETVFKPMQDEYLEEAKTYGSEEKQQQAAAEARADVQQAAAVAKGANARSNASMGIDPTSGRYQGLDRATDMGYALAEAGASNNARTMQRDKGLAMKADALNIGNGLPAQALAGAGGSVGAGSSALGGNHATNGQFLGATGIMGQGFQGAMSGYNGMGSTLNTQYGHQLDAWKAEQQMKSQGIAGIGGALGSVAGMFLSDEDLKEEKTAIPDGEALDAVNEMRVEEWKYKDGVADEDTHVGTYAQDFQKATGKGDGKSIPAIDAVGITMKAVQDLSDKVDKGFEALGLGGHETTKKPKRKSKSGGSETSRGSDFEFGLGAFA